MSAETTLGAVSGAACAAYGFWLLRQPVSAGRTLVKVTPVAALAVMAYLAGAPLPLTAALVLSAVGDGFLAGDAERWLPAGLSAFLLAHLSYIWLFVHDGGGRAALIAEPVRTLGVAAAFAVAVTMLAWLWRSLGPLRGAVLVYVAAICLMAAASFTLPHRLWPAMLGASAFVASDGLLSAELFKGLKARWVTYAVWWLYYAAQALITWAYLR
ncbi:MAG: lysoplasmalogenase [Nevskia sp.]|nr:lysoplasmalogenase [Nevskia sp.]